MSQKNFQGSIVAELSPIFITYMLIHKMRLHFFGILLLRQVLGKTVPEALHERLEYYSVLITVVTYMLTPAPVDCENKWNHISSFESQKGINTIQRCCAEKQKGIDVV